jgi:hypothetical protein
MSAEPTRNKVELSLDLEGPISVAETSELCAWLHDSRIRGVDSVKQAEAPPARGEQGPTLLAVLTIVLGSHALAELIRSIDRYIEARTPKIKLKIKTRSKLIEIDCTNPPPLLELINQVNRLAVD